jgi:hypothetical protein
VETTATDQVQQHGLQVVLGSVGGGDFCVRRQSREEFIAKGPGCLLSAYFVGSGIGGYITSANRQGDFMKSAVASDKVLVPLGFLPTEHMVKMCGNYGNSQFLPGTKEHMQQGHRVLSAGDRADHVISRRKHVLLTDKR